MGMSRSTDAGAVEGEYPPATVAPRYRVTAAKPKVTARNENFMKTTPSLAIPYAIPPWLVCNFTQCGACNTRPQVMGPLQEIAMVQRQIGLVVIAFSILAVSHQRSYAQTQSDKPRITPEAQEVIEKYVQAMGAAEAL